MTNLKQTALVLGGSGRSGSLIAKQLTDRGVRARAASRHGTDLLFDWINGAIAAGVPADYAEMLRWLTGSIIAGKGSAPTGDVEAVIGRPATSFEAFARRSIAVWTK